MFPFTQPVDALIHLASEPLDLTITDTHMPKHDGMTVVREARRLPAEHLHPHHHRHTSRYPIEDPMEEGTANIMFKPFHMNELRTRLALAKLRRDLIDRLHQEKTL